MEMNDTDSGYRRFNLQTLLDEMEKSYHNNFAFLEVILTILLTIISLLGIVGNSLVILVFQRQSKNSSSNFFIVILGIIDLLICIFCIPTSLVIEVWRFPTYDIICKLLNWFRCFLVLFSPMLLILIAIDRCLLICFVPSKHIKVKLAPFLLVLIIIISTCLSVPSGLISGIVINIIEGNLTNFDFNITMLNKMHQFLADKFLTSSCHIDERYINAKQFNVYRYFVFSLFFTILSSLILLYASIFTFIIIQHSRWKQHTQHYKLPSINKSGKNDQNATDTQRLQSTEMTYVKKSKSLTMDSKMNFNEICSFIIYSPKTFKLKSRANSVKSEGFASQQKFGKSKSETRKPSRSNKTLKTLLLVSLSFIISFAPYLLVSTGILYFHNSLSYKEKVIKSLLYYTYNLNSVLNPLIYSCMNTSFQKELKKLTKLRLCWTSNY